MPTQPPSKPTTRSNSVSRAEETMISEIMEKLNDNRTYMEQQFSQLNTALKGLTIRLDSMETRQLEVEKTLTYHGDEILDIRRQLKDFESLKADIDQLRETQLKETQLVQKKVEVLQSEKLLHTLRVTGIPPAPRENLKDLIIKLGKQMTHLAFKMEDIEAVFRPKDTVKGSSQVILVRFKSITKRDEFYKSRNQLKLKNITTQSLGMETCNQIYINESLSPAAQILFYQARKRKIELNYAHIWTFHSQIYMKKSSATEAVRIVNQETLHNLV